MRERKRWIALGVTLTLGVASLAGCGTKNTTKDHSTVEESSQNPDTEPTTEQASDAETTIDAELRELENKAQVINDQLEDGSLSQGDMNQLSSELYALWDDELNSIWKRIKNKLDADAMRKSRCKVCSFFYIYNEKCENSIKCSLKKCGNVGEDMFLRSFHK